MLGCFKTIHLIWGTFTSEALTFSLWLTCRPSSLWATVVSCLAMAIDNSDQGIFIHTATLSSFILAIGKRTWLCIINLVIYACKSLWPLQQCACIVFLPHVGAKDEKLFFLYWSECHAENVTGLFAQFLNSQNQAEWKSTLRGSSIN